MSCPIAIRVAPNRGFLHPGIRRPRPASSGGPFLGWLTLGCLLLGAGLAQASGVSQPSNAKSSANGAPQLWDNPVQTDSARCLHFDDIWDLDFFRNLSGTWTLYNGVYAVTANPLGLAVLLETGLGVNGPETQRVPSRFTHVDIECGVKLPVAALKGRAGVLFRTPTVPSNPEIIEGYFVGINRETSRIEITHVGGSWSVIDSQSIASFTNEYQTLYISLRHHSIRISLVPDAVPLLVSPEIPNLDGSTIALCAQHTRAVFSHLAILPVGQVGVASGPTCVQHRSSGRRTGPEANTRVAPPKTWPRVSPLKLPLGLVR